MRILQLVPYVYQRSALIREVWDEAGIKPSDIRSLADFKNVGPLVRFRTDDLVEYTSAPCTCGRTHGRIRPLGRKGDEMLIQGRSVLPPDIFPLMHQFPATQSALFQLVRPQREADVLKLRVGYEAELLAGSKDELADGICEAIRAALGVSAEVELIENTELLKNGPPNKIPRVTKA